MLPRASLFRAFINTARTRTRTRPRTTDPTLRLYSTTRPHSQAMAAVTDSQATVEADTSGVTPESITATLKSKLDVAHVEIEDMSGKKNPPFFLRYSTSFSSSSLLPIPPSQHTHSTLLSRFLTPRLQAAVDKPSTRSSCRRNSRPRPCWRGTGSSTRRSKPRSRPFTPGRRNATRRSSGRRRRRRSRSRSR